jgi:hypothetical protein
LALALHRVSRWQGITTLTLAAVLAAGIGQASAGHVVLRRLGLLGGPAPYTSLAFLHPQSLPGQLPAARARVDTSFVIYNSDVARHDYQWSLQLVHSGHDRVVDAGAVQVPGRHRTVILRATEISCSGGEVEIVIKLIHPAEAIDAFAACRTSRK